jgi:hypothetical protein
VTRWSDPDSDPEADIRELHTRLSTPDGQSQLKQLIALSEANQRKVEHEEQQNKLDMLSPGMGAIYEVNRNDGSSTHVGWIADRGDPVDLVGDPLVVKPGSAYQTMVSTGTASQGSKPAVVVPGIQRPANVTSGWSPGGLPVIIKASSVATAPILTTNTATLLPGVPVSSGFNYGPTTKAGFQAVNTYPTGDSENANPEFNPEWFATKWNSRDDISIDPDEYPDEVSHFWFDVICLPQKDFDDDGNLIEGPTVTYWFHSNMPYKAAAMLLLSLQVTSQKVTRMIEVWDFENERSEWVVV